MGPLRLTDLVGLDVRLHIAEYLHGELGLEAFRPNEILRRMVSEGKLGEKSGEGFYKWNEQEAGQKAILGNLPGLNGY
jgi:3-hydroxybutyryl-CoA dehydrogenase